MQVLVTRIVTRLLFLAVSEQLHDLLVRLGDAGGAHGAELDASLLRAAEDGVVAITDDHGGAGGEGLPASYDEPDAASYEPQSEGRRASSSAASRARLAFEVFARKTLCAAK